MTFNTAAMTLRRALFATLGVMALATGIVGVFVPGLPTTEFILAASYLFARSSPRLEAWLRGNRWCGPMLRGFSLTRRMPVAVARLRARLHGQTTVAR